MRDLPQKTHTPFATSVDHIEARKCLRKPATSSGAIDFEYRAEYDRETDIVRQGFSFHTVSCRYVISISCLAQEASRHGLPFLALTEQGAEYPASDSNRG